MRRALAKRSRALLVVMVLAFGLVACGETLDQTTGVVITIDSPAFGQVDGFELVTPAGERLVFDTTELVFRSDFPAGHVGEHQRLSEPVEVTYRRDDGRLIVTRIVDAD